MHEWKPGYKVISRDRLSIIMEDYYRTVVKYPKHEIACPRSWLHGPLCVFEDEASAALFSCTMAWPESRIVKCAYIPSGHTTIWRPHKTIYCEDVYAEYLNSELPTGTALAEAVYCFE